MGAVDEGMGKIPHFLDVKGLILSYLIKLIVELYTFQVFEYSLNSLENCIIVRLSPRKSNIFFI